MSEPALETRALRKDYGARAAVRDLTLIAQALDPEDMRNRVEFLPL